MRHLLIVVVFLVTGAFVRAQELPSFTLTALTAQKVPVTEHKMTNLVFPVAIRTGIKVSREVLVQKVKGVDNVIELKAARPRFAPTNLSVFGLDGRLYSFDLEYADNPPVLNFAVVPAPAGKSVAHSSGKPLVILTGLPADQATLAEDAGSLTKEKGFLHVSVHREKMRLRVEGIYLKDSLLWFTLRLRNATQVPYSPDHIRMFIQERTKARRTAIQETAIEPIYAALPGQVTGRSSEIFALGYPLFTVPQDKEVWLELAEGSGGRLLKLPISYKTILKATSIN